MKRILVATDFSTRSDRALRRAVLIAAQSGAALTLVHVVDDDQPAYLIDTQHREAMHLLEQTARTIRDVDGIATDRVVTTGEAFTGILKTAEQRDTDLIVVGPHRRQLLDVFIGTTAERTIRRGRRPVLMANAVPAGPYLRSLVALALDEVSRETAETVRQLGILDRTEVIALHLFDAPAVSMMKRAMEVQEAIDHYIAREASRVGDELDALLARTGLRASQRLLRHEQGSPGTAILSWAEELDADLIVLGAGRQPGLKRFLVGSVTQEVLLDAQRDVLVIPAATETDEPVAQ